MFIDITNVKFLTPTVLALPMLAIGALFTVS
jgi:hypothetical protein